MLSFVTYFETCYNYHCIRASSRVQLFIIFKKKKAH